MKSYPYLELFVETLNSDESKSDRTVFEAISLSKHREPVLRQNLRQSRARSVVPTPLATESRANRRRKPRSRSPRSTEQEDLGNLADDTEEGSLLETWERNKVSGPGVEVLERSQDRQTLSAFLADSRMDIPMAKKYVTKIENKEARGKTLHYEREDKEIREGLDISRRTEWEKWQKFIAGRPCRGAELKKLLDEGHNPIPMRWVDVDKASHRRRQGGPYVPPEYKSRLCGRGDLEGIGGLRNDSTTAEIEAHHLLFSFASSNRLKLKIADISNAYFQGEQMDRLLLMRPPKGGIPDPEYEDGETFILARVPIYGTQDAGRK
jgi:hypothetical protein